MLTGEYWKLQDDRSLSKIDDAAVQLLTESGVRIVHDGLLDMLESAGCRIERTSMRCYLPEKLIRDVIAHFGDHIDERVCIPAGWNPQHHLGHGGSYPHLLEWPSGRRRLATKEDVVDMARMAHVMNDFDSVGKVLVCSEVDPRIEPLWTTLQLAQTTDKPIGGGEVLFADQIEPLVRMGEIISGKPGDTSLVADCDFFIAPLILDTRQADCFLAKCSLGMRIVPGTMPISGMSAPVTIAGTIAIAVAELIAGWVLGYVINPERNASGIVASGSMDMRTASACFGSPEALLQDTTTVELCRRLYGIQVYAATGYVDCKHPGLEATFQKMFPLAAVALGASRCIDSAGLLSAGQDYSPVQHLLDAEMNKALERFWGGFEVSDETIALELIQEQITGAGAGFIQTDHTLAHFRSEAWYPKWFDRRLWQGEAAEVQYEHEMLERIHRYCTDAIRRYEPPEIDKSKITELQRVLLSAQCDVQVK